MKAQIIRKASLAAVLGFAALAVHATEWTYYAASDTGNPTTVACITDGNWVLKVSQKLSSTIKFETYCVVSGSGVLDLRQLTIDGTVYTNYFLNAAGSYPTFQGCKTMTDFYADNVAVLPATTFQSCSSLAKVSLSGTFTQIGDKCFSSCSSLESIVLNAPKLANIKDQALSTSALRTLEITTDKEVAVVSTAVSWTAGNYLTSLTINCPEAWTTTNVDRLLKGLYGAGGVPERDGTTADKADKVCTIYVNSDTWASLAASLTDYEKAVKPKKCFGVYRDGLRKAWLVATNEKRGFAIIVR